MGSLFEWITDWIKEGLIDAITGQYTSIFNSVNNQVADVANQVDSLLSEPGNTGYLLCF